MWKSRISNVIQHLSCFDENYTDTFFTPQLHLHIWTLNTTSFHIQKKTTTKPPKSSLQRSHRRKKITLYSYRGDKKNLPPPQKKSNVYPLKSCQNPEKNLLRRLGSWAVNEGGRVASICLPPHGGYVTPLTQGSGKGELFYAGDSYI